MINPRLAELVPVLQVAIGPVILISRIGLLLLSMTNRYGRIVERSRIVPATRRDAAGDEKTPRRLVAFIKEFNVSLTLRLDILDA